MSFRSAAGWFWPDFDALPVEPVPPAPRLPAQGAETPPPVARADRWAQPAPPPAHRAGEARPAASPRPSAVPPAGAGRGSVTGTRSLNRVDG